MARRNRIDFMLTHNLIAAKLSKNFVIPKKITTFVPKLQKMGDVRKKRIRKTAVLAAVAVVAVASILAVAAVRNAHRKKTIAEAGELLGGAGATETPESGSELSSEPAYVLGEASWERSYNTKTFRLSDGSFTLADYTHPVHFKDETDAWTDYDNTLLPVEGGYRNTASDVFFTFPDSSSEDPVLVESDRYQIRFSLLNSSSSSIEIHNPEKKPEGA